jgi:hypothetical protein
MSKKNRNKNKHHSVLSSLKDLGNKPRETLSRLATTVKTDAPTLLVDKGDGKGHAAKRAAGPTRLSRMAQHINPFSPQRRAKAKMAKLQRQMVGSMPVRRSRLPLVYAVLAMLCLSGGAWVYTHVSLPEIRVAQYLDYQKWLELVSGRRRGEGGDGKSTKSEKRSAEIAGTRHEDRGPARELKSDRHAVITSPNAASKLDSKLGKGKLPRGKSEKIADASGKAKASPKAKAKSAKTAKAGKGAKGAKSGKAFAKLSKSQKEKVWKAKLAKLRKQSDAKYRKASYSRN